jgi:hypothetical protein
MSNNLGNARKFLLGAQFRMFVAAEVFRLGTLLYAIPRPLLEAIDRVCQSDTKGDRFRFALCHHTMKDNTSNRVLCKSYV